MSVLAPKIPVAIYLYREDPNVTPEPARKISSVESKRRSVSSMKGLMPLALPTSCNTTSNSTPIDIMDSMIDYLPEMLARDLELSSDVFAAKNMTAGTPSMSLLFEEDESSPRTCPGRILISPYPSTLARVQTLGAIEERDSLVSFTEHQLYATDVTNSDLESISGTEVSVGIEPPSIRLREQSIITAATSLTSNSGAPPSPKDLMSLDRSQGYSWIDIDSDEDEDDGDIDDEAPTEERPVALSPRPPTPPSIDGHFYITGHSREVSRSSTTTYQSRTRTNSGGPVSLHRSKHSVNSIEIPLRGTSLSHTTKGLESIADLQISRRESKMSIASRRKNLQLARKSFSFDDEVRVERYETLERIPQESDRDSIDLELDSLADMDLPPWPRPNTVYLQKSPPPSPLPSVQAWLDQSNPQYPSQLLGEDLAKTVPLPPDIIETLRVSIACFPETMLLSSSLTIETIRTYSRKVRQTSHDGWRDSLMADSVPINTNRRSIWKKVVSHGRESLAIRLQKSLPPLDNGDLETSNHRAVAPWSSLRHVFSSCSDYICDALYAHIVAYNYISRVPRSQPPQPNRASVMASKQQSQNEDIPKKAATLLGLSAPQSPSPPAVGRFTKKLSSPLTVWGFGKDQMSSSSSGNTATAAQHDNATRNIESGLMRCIVRLIATAKMMSKDGAEEERLVEVEPNEVDMIFVRSLCEIVRIAEDAA